MNAIRHPEFEVRLVGEDGNAYAILGRVLGSLRRAGVSKEERDEFARAHAGTPEAADIVAGQLEQYLVVGQLITQVLDEGKADDPEALTQRGVEILKTAVDELTARKEALDEESMGDVTPERQPDLDLERMLNSYGLARTQYFRALLYPPAASSAS